MWQNHVDLPIIERLYIARQLAMNHVSNEPGANPYITQLGHPFPTPVRLFVNAGTSELFFERITQWAEEMRGVEGNVVELHGEEDAVQDTYLTAQLMGFEESAWAEKQGQ